MTLRHDCTFVSLIVALVIGLTTSHIASAASGEGKSEFYRGFYVELGSFSPLDVETRLDISIPEFDLEFDLGEEIDLESVFDNSEREDRGRFRGGYRFNRRHELEFSYLSVTREYGRSFEESFEFLGQEFTVGLDLQAMLKTEDVELGYKYFIVVRPRGELGFSVGLHAVLTEFSLAGQAFLPQGFEDIVDRSFFESDSLDVPLPYLGLFFDLKFGGKFYFGALGKILEVEIDDYSGNWTTFEVNLEHWTFKHLGFGVGYYFNDLDVSKQGVRDFALAGVDVEQSGVQGYLRLSI